MSDQDFSYQVLAMILANRDKGNVSKYLDRLNQTVIGSEVPEVVKGEILEFIQQFFQEEDERFQSFRTKIESLLLQHVK